MALLLVNAQGRVELVSSDYSAATWSAESRLLIESTLDAGGHLVSVSLDTAKHYFGAKVDVTVTLPPAEAG